MTQAQVLGMLVRYLLAVMAAGGFLVLIAGKLRHKYQEPVSNYGAFLFLCSAFGLLLLAAAYIGINR